MKLKAFCVTQNETPKTAKISVSTNKLSRFFTEHATKCCTCIRYSIKCCLKEKGQCFYLNLHKCQRYILLSVRQKLSVDEPQENQSNCYEISIDLTSSSLKKDIDFIEKDDGKINGGAFLRRLVICFLKKAIISLIKISNSINGIKIFWSVYQVILKTS